VTVEREEQLLADVRRDLDAGTTNMKFIETAVSLLGQIVYAEEQPRVGHDNAMIAVAEMTVRVGRAIATEIKERMASMPSLARH
jgi:hypothetical protein